MRILFLYTELADYTIACYRALKNSNPDTSILVVHYPVNPEAPFSFDLEGIGKFISIDKIDSYNSLEKLVGDHQPDKIVCCGWINKWYLKICWEYRGKAICILTLDNHWKNNFKQKLFGIFSFFTLSRIFKKIWIPGKPQLKYANKIGFHGKDILTGYYSCDLNQFNGFFEKFKEQKAKQFPHRFICTARYISSKNYELLWDAFIEWKSKFENDWELWCVGTGELYDKRVSHPAIRHLGFVQKNDWEKIISGTGVFVLASLHEPWGVVVHEFSAAGYPLLISKYVGSGSAFLNIINGTQFDPSSKNELVHEFEKFSLLTDEQLFNMGNASNRIAQQISPEKWAATLLNKYV